MVEDLSAGSVGHMNKFSSSVVLGEPAPGGVAGLFQAA